MTLGLGPGILFDFGDDRGDVDHAARERSTVSAMLLDDVEEARVVKQQLG